MEQFQTIKQLNPGYSSSTLTLYYDTMNDEIHINWMPINDFDDGKWQPTRMQTDPNTHVLNYANIYDTTFGEYERKRSIAINFRCDEVQPPYYGQCPATFIFRRLNIYHYHLPTSYINIIFVRNAKSIQIVKTEMYMLKQKKFKRVFPMEDWKLIEGTEA